MKEEGIQNENNMNDLHWNKSNQWKKKKRKKKNGYRGKEDGGTWDQKTRMKNKVQRKKKKKQKTEHVLTQNRF